MNYKNKLVITSVCLSIFASLFASPAFAGRFALRGHVNPEYQGKQIRKMAVVAPNVVPYFRAQIEKRMCNWLSSMSNGGVTGVRLGNVVSSFKQLTGEEIIASLRSQQVDVVAVVDIQMDGGRYAPPGSQADETIPEDMAGALEYSANLKYRAKFDGKYRSTRVTVYDVKTGDVMWQGHGKVNATQDSRKWHKKSGRYLAKRFAKYMRKARVLTYIKEAPDPDEVYEVEGTNYTSGS